VGPAWPKGNVDFQIAVPHVSSRGLSCRSAVIGLYRFSGLNGVGSYVPMGTVSSIVVSMLAIRSALLVCGLGFTVAVTVAWDSFRFAEFMF
jgi:hypothetical protein